MTASSAFRFGVLGPLQVVADSGPISIAAPRSRAVLAFLLLHHDRLVTLEEIIDAIWFPDPPTTVRSQVRTAVFQLRRMLGDNERSVDEQVLVTRNPGYLLRVAPERLDLSRFEALCASVEGHTAAGRREAAADALRASLDLWRGPALADVVAPFAEGARRDLALRKLAAVERLADVEFSRGRGLDLVPTLRLLIEEHPLHERLRAQLMTALYRSGQVDAALETFRATRQTFAEQLGIEPSVELTRLHKSMLQRDPELAAPSTSDGTAVVPHQLPRRPSLVGRGQEAARIRSLLGEAGVAAPVVALHGPGGVGKSALALSVAHDLADAFPDGQIYVDLRGSSPGTSPLPPWEVLGRFLRALGAPVESLPADEAEAATLFQSMLSGRRVLLVLDNAIDTAQVTPLLPAAEGCACLITARAVLSTLDCRNWPVAALGEADAVRMLAVGVADGRIDREPEAANEIAVLCGGLPLALRIAAARLAGRPDWSVADLLGRLRDRRRRLDELHSHDLAVRPCLEVGVSALDGGVVAQAFRLFGVFGIPKMGAQVMAALLDTGEDEAGRILDRLVEARLIEPVGGDRYGCHDLLRLYAAELAEREDPPQARTEALRRAMLWYVQAICQVQELFRPQTRTGKPPTEVLGPIDDAAAVRWFDEEMPNLMAAAGVVADAEPELASFVNELRIWALAQRRGYWAELGTLGRLGLRISRWASNLVHEAAALIALGYSAWRAGDSEQARRYFVESRLCWEKVGSPEDILRAWANAAWLRLVTNDHEGAERDLETALSLFDQDTPRGMAGTILHNLAEAKLRLGRHEEAVRLLEREVLPLRREIADQVGESLTLMSLGQAYALLDERERALAVLGEALAASAEAKGQNMWHALLARSEIRRRQALFADALEDARAAYSQNVSNNDRYGQAVAAWLLNRIYAESGDAESARFYAAQAEHLSEKDRPTEPVLEQLLMGTDIIQHR